MTRIPGYPEKQGLYDPAYESDACGIGFVVNIKGRKSHKLVRQALEVLEHLEHRGACGCEANTGDGAGMLLQLPHAFFAAVCDFELPEPGEYGVGMLFLPSDEGQRKACEERFEKIVAEEGQHFLGWRDVPTNNAALGNTAKAREPFQRQAFIGRGEVRGDGELAFERKLYVICKRTENAIRYSGEFGNGDFFYPASLSSRTIVYKGMLIPDQVKDYFPDMVDERFESAIALVHSRFSTNTFPSWERAHPYRYMIHNGEINTVRGNGNWMHAREGMLASELFGDDIEKLFPVIHEDGSDSAKFDNALELLSLGGRSLAHAVMMMIPEPWEKHETMSDEKRAFYEYHSCLMEPWDGPASVAFTDGTVVGGMLDRNGFRPSRYYITKDDTLVLSSEPGVLAIPPQDVVPKARLQPGRMLLIATHARDPGQAAFTKPRGGTALAAGFRLHF